jgi:photosystem II stability/assembly factor-like uncharacterized protein
MHNRFGILVLTTTLTATFGTLGCSDDDPSGTGAAGGAGGAGGSTGASGGMGGSGGAAGPGGSGGSEGGGTPQGWVQWPAFADDTFEVDGEMVTNEHSGDRVYAIHFDSLDHGVVGTREEGLPYYGGAIFEADGNGATTVAHRAYFEESLGFFPYDYEIIGFTTLAGGLVARTNRSGAFLRSDDDGTTWTVGRMGVNDEVLNGGGLELLHRAPSGKYTLMTEFGVLTSTTAPASTTAWTPVFFPESIPTVPSPLPADNCQTAPARPYKTPNGYPWGFATPDGSVMGYGLRLPAADLPAHGICISVDGGATFRSRFYPLEILPEEAQDEYLGPNGALFLDSQVGFAYYSNSLYEKKSFVVRTTDGGMTWSAGALPAEFNAPNASFSFGNLFFAPDKQHGWLGGYDHTLALPLLLKTSDGGVTWTRLSSVNKPEWSDYGIYAGFALDEDHIWIGGDDGFVAQNDNGGE